MPSRSLFPSSHPSLAICRQKVVLPMPSGKKSKLLGGRDARKMSPRTSSSEMARPQRWKKMPLGGIPFCFRQRQTWIIGPADPTVQRRSCRRRPTILEVSRGGPVKLTEGVERDVKSSVPGFFTIHEETFDVRSRGIGLLFSNPARPPPNASLTRSYCCHTRQ